MDAFFNMSKFISKILFVLFLISNISYGQENKVLRIELDTQKDEYPYSLIPLKDDGLMLFYKTEESASASGTNWYFAFYDTNFKKVSSKEIPVNSKQSFVKDILRNDTVFLLFQDVSKKNRLNDYSIIAISIQSKGYSIINGIFPDKGNVKDFQIYGSKVLFNFQVEDEYATILARDLNTDKTEDYFFEDRSIVEIDKMILDSITNSINLILAKSVAKKQLGLFYCVIDIDGNFRDSIQLKAGVEDKQLNKAMLYINENGDKIIIGTYITTKGKSSKADSEDENESSGIFFIKVNDAHQQFIKYYSYLDFKNFSVYLTDVDFMKYKRKAEKREKKGKEFSINYKLLVHDIINQGEQYIFGAEAYYPEYHTVSYMSYDYYGRPVPQYYSVFDGYRYTNALIASFNVDGDILWSNIFDMYKILSFSLKKRVNYFFDDNDIVLSYSEDGQIVSKVINGAQAVGEVDYTEIATSHSNDDISSDERTDMEQWYGNYFIIYGYQSIKNNYLSGKKKRTVFYVNKIAFE